MPVETRYRPSHREALVAVSEAVDSGNLVTIQGRCAVEYEGRAASSLGPGDRLVVLKPDGSALVHTVEGRTPVNWQPPGASHRASVRDGRLHVLSRRETPDERLEVRFDRVYLLTALDAQDEAEIALTGSEADLRERVLESPDIVGADFEPLATERETDAGAIDVFGRDGEGGPVVVELKRRRVGPDAVGQLRRYVDAIRREEGDGVAVREVLVAPSVTDRAAERLDERGLEHVACSPPSDEETTGVGGAVVEGETTGTEEDE